VPSAWRILGPQELPGKPGTGAHIYNPCYPEGRDLKDHSPRQKKAGTTWLKCSPSKKKKKKTNFQAKRAGNNKKG
jgi:hypothetical protein